MTTKEEETQTFIIPNDIEIANKLTPFMIYEQYLAVLPKELQIGRVFKRFDPTKDTFTSQVLGRNTIAKIPGKIAKILKLDNHLQYTGHSFRVSSATTLADEGISLTNLKRHGGWKSDTVAEGYIRNSDATLKENAMLLTGGKKIKIEKNDENEKENVSFWNSNVTNCTFNINIMQEPKK